MRNRLREWLDETFSGWESALVLVGLFAVVAFVTHL